MRCGRFSGELQENFFETDGGGAKFIEVPAGFDDRAGQIATDQALAAFDFEDRAIVALVFEIYAADAGNEFKA